MNFHADIFKTDNFIITSNLSTATDELKIPKHNLTKDSTAQQSAKNLFDKSLKAQKEQIKTREKDAKQFRVLKRYGEILKKVEKLLGMLPSDFENLSLEELAEKLQDLMKTRKRNEQQMLFIFYQNLYSTTLKNLMTLEKDFQSGAITQNDAKKSIRDIKSQIETEQAHVPKVLSQTNEQVKRLVDLYDESFSSKNAESNNRSSLLTEPNLSTENKLLFEKLNYDTAQTLKQVEDLNANLSNFEPQVDLKKLTKALEESERLASDQIFDVERLDSSLTTLEETTNSLTNQQVEKNTASEKFSEEIKTLTEQSQELKETSMFDISSKTFEDVHYRATITIGAVEEVKEIINSDEPLPEAISEQLSNTLVTQIEADLYFCDRVCMDENSASENYDKTLSEKALEEATELKTLVKEKMVEKDLVLTLKQDTNPNGENSNI